MNTNKPFFYVTTPIYYVNGDPHLGTAYTTLIADCLARFHRFLGASVRFTTGTDEHGQKVQESAKENHKSPQEHVDFMSKRFLDAWNTLGLQYDDFIRTTEARHKEVAAKLWQKLEKSGHIYPGKYRGWYCKWDETFYPESKVDPERIKPGAERPLQFIEEDNFFFRLSAFQEPLLKHFRENPDFVLPRFRSREMIAILEGGLEDLSISRPSVDWGIKVPGNPEHTMYVWVEALMNYLTSAGYEQEPERFLKTWPASVQIVGKDILKFHSIIWPALLMGLELPLPKTILAHGYILNDGIKMSKSRGNVVDPLELSQKFGSDPLRFSLLREVSIGQDGSFDESVLIRRTNTELANDLGNLVQRILSIGLKHCPVLQKPDSAPVWQEELQKIADSFLGEMEALNLNQALEHLMKFTVLLNRLVDQEKPWALAKEKESLKLNHLVYHLLDSLRVFAHLASPFLPQTSQKLLEMLENNQTPCRSRIQFGLLIENFTLKPLEPLFPRILQEVKAPKPEQPKETLVSMEDFQKLKFELVTVVEAKPHPDATKLLVLQVSTSQGRKQIVSGIAEFYKAEDLIGKQVVLLKNLAEATIRGVKSEGMILAASNRRELALLVADQKIQEGSKVS